MYNEMRCGYLGNQKEIEYIGVLLVLKSDTAIDINSSVFMCPYVVFERFVMEIGKLEDIGR